MALQFIYLHVKISHVCTMYCVVWICMYLYLSQKQEEQQDKNNKNNNFWTHRLWCSLWKLNPQTDYDTDDTGTIYPWLGLHWEIKPSEKAIFFRPVPGLISQWCPRQGHIISTYILCFIQL